MNADRSRTRWILAVILAALFILSLGLFSYKNWQVGSAPVEIGISAILLSVPLLLFFGSIWLLVVTWSQKNSQQPASPRIRKWIYWSPRIAGILISLFVAVFALDAFGPGQSIWQQILAFFIHALPAILMGIIVALAWRWPAVGVVAFLLVALFFLRSLIFNPLQGLGLMLLFSGPMAAIAMLFWMNWKWGKWLRPSGGARDGGERQNDDREQQVQAQH